MTHVYSYTLLYCTGDKSEGKGLPVTKLNSEITEEEKSCVDAFKSGNKQVAEQLLTSPHLHPAAIGTKFFLGDQSANTATAEVSLLHLAAYWGWKDIAILLVSVYNCDANWNDDAGQTPLYYSVYNGHLELVKYFISEQLLNPKDRNKNGNTLLHLACKNGHLNVVHYLISEAHCNPSFENNIGNTPLHLACENGHLNIVQYLISEVHCNPSCVNNIGNSPLHLACKNGHLNIVLQYLISEVHCNPSLENNIGSTPLHLACENGHLNIIQYLISEVHCNPSCVNNIGNSPLHLACENSHLNVVQYLISEAHCNPSLENNVGNTPLHLACENGHLNIVQYLISVAHCNPSSVDKIGITPLHRACLCNHAHIVQYLLSTGCVNPLAEDQVGNTPLSFVTGKYDIIKLLQPYTDCSRDYPVHTFTKLILMGDTGAGKTTIAQLITILAHRSSSAPAVDCVADVKHFTAGIIPHHIVSNLGNFVVYDFAGQQEYYSSHAAILEQVMHKSPAVFLCMIDLSKSNDIIFQSLQYWLSFIENACSTVEGMSHLAIVGSHADLVRSSTEMEEKSSLVHKMATVRVNYQKYMYAGYVTMDCRQADTDTVLVLVSILTNSQKAIISSQPAISIYCHILYAFLRSKLNAGLHATASDLCHHS